MFQTLMDFSFATAPIETAGSVAFGASDSMGSIASNSVETAGSVACGSFSGDSGASSAVADLFQFANSLN